MSSTQPEGADQHVGTYVYCVTRAQALPKGGGDGQMLDVSGVGNEPVRAVEYTDLAAIVSDSPSDSYDVTREALNAHERVVEKVMEQADVLPVSFGTVAEDDDAVRQQLLAAVTDALHQALDTVHDRVELGVKALWEKDRLYAELAEQDESIRTLRDEIAGTTEEETYDQRAQLGELIANAIEQKRDQEAAEIMNTLKPLAVDARVNDVYTDLMVLNASFLVDKQQITAFEAQVDQLRQAQAGRLNIKYTRPLPPYNFVSIAPGKGEENVEVAR